MLWMLMVAPTVQAGPVQVGPDPCPAIARLIASARERPAFETVRQALARGESVVPGFSARSCRIGAEGSLDCSVSGMEARVGGIGEPLRCRGLRPVALPQPADRFPNTRAHSYTARELRVSHGVTCLSCAGPARRFFRVELEGGRPSRF